MGAVVGACLAGVALAWIIVANTEPSRERFASERNMAATAGVGLLLFVLICRFMSSPGRLFLSGIFAWTILSITYRTVEFHYPAIANRLGAFHLFMLGAVLIGLIAALLWVLEMMVEMRHHPTPVTRRRLP